MDAAPGAKFVGCFLDDGKNPALDGQALKHNNIDAEVKRGKITARVGVALLVTIELKNAWRYIIECGKKNDVVGWT